MAAARLPAALVFFIPYLPPSIQLGMTGIQLHAILISISLKIREFGVTEAQNMMPMDNTTDPPFRDLTLENLENNFGELSNMTPDAALGALSEVVHSP